MSLALGWTFDGTLTDYVTGLAPSFVTTGAYAATGGTITAAGGNRIHTFTTVGTDSITFSSPGTIQLLVVGGGGGGGSTTASAILAGGGGGAGEVAYYASYPVNAETYTIVVGDGGKGGQATAVSNINAADGFISSFGTLQANGGGGGSSGGAGISNGFDGGSGGGTARDAFVSTVGGASVKTAGGLGNKGGDCVNGTNFSAGGGGGAGSAGTAASATGSTPVPGGSGVSISISGTSVTYGAGGTGGARSNTVAPSTTLANLGNGGAGAPGGTASVSGAAGGSGIVIVSYNAASFAPTYNFFPGIPQLQGTAALVNNAPTSNTAVSFPGTTGSYMTLGSNMPTNFNTNSSNLFVEMWMNATSLTPACRLYGRAALVTSAAAAINYNLRFDSTGVLGLTNGVDLPVTATGTITTGTWNHAAFSITTTGLVTVFLNGQAGTPTTVTMSYNSTYSTFIGAMFSAYYNGYIRDIRVVQGGVVPTASFPPELAPFSYSNLPSYVTGSGSTVFTLLNQFIPSPVVGVYRQGVSFNNENAGTGANSYVTYSLSPSFSPTSFTWAHWVNFRQIPAQNIQFPLYFTDSLASSPFIRVGLNPSGFTGNGTQPYMYNGTSYLLGPVMTQGVWYHFCVVLTAGSGGSTATFYVNGTSYGSIVLTNNQAATIDTMYVGSASTSYGAMCSVDDLRLYNGALNATQVQALYAVNGVPLPVALNNLTNYSSNVGSAYGGTTLLTQVSSTNAVVGYSLRAINATTAVVANVAVQISLPSFTSAATSINGNIFSQVLTSSFPYGDSGTYIASSSSLYNNTTNPAWRAFDNNTGTFWESYQNLYTGTPGTTYSGTRTTTVGGVATPGEWIQIQMPEAMTLDSYLMYGRVNFTYRMPYNWIVAGSNDGTTWTQVNSQTAQKSWRGQEPISYSVNSTTPYLYFRMIVTAIVDGSGAQNVNLGQWTINVSKSTWSRDVSADIYGNLTTSTGQELSSYLGSATGFVTAWYDQSGAGNNATQTTRAYQPIIQKSSVGPGWSLLFDGLADYLTGMSYTVMNNTNYSFSILERRNKGANMFMVSSGNTGTDTEFLVGYYISGGFYVPRFGQYNDDLDINPYPTYTYTGEPIHYWAGSQSSTAGRLYYENGIVASSNVLKTTLVSSTSGNFLVGVFVGGSGTTQGYYSGELYEVIIWKRVLASDEAIQVYNNQYGYINGNPGSIMFS